MYWCFLVDEQCHAVSTTLLAGLDQLRVVNRVGSIEAGLGQLDSLQGTSIAFWPLHWLPPGSELVAACMAKKISEPGMICK